MPKFYFEGREPLRNTGITKHVWNTLVQTLFSSTHADTFLLDVIFSGYYIAEMKSVPLPCRRVYVFICRGCHARVNYVIMNVAVSVRETKGK